MKEKALIIVMGVSGSGKTSVGKGIASQMNIPFYDGDDFHPEANIEKMKAGKPLNDADRAPWLTEINHFAKRVLQHSSLIIACSALKASYRKTLAQDITTIFLYLKGSQELILQRLNSRKGHFMPSNLLSSQFETLEEPSDVIKVEIDRPLDDIISEAFDELKLQLDVD